MEYIEINGLKIHYHQTGSGPAVILLHGWGCNYTIFRHLQESLATNFTVYAIDFPGFGNSDVPQSVWGIEEYTQMVEGFVKALHIESPTLIGHSFGGRVSIVYASRNKIKKIVLVGSAGIKPRRKLSYYLKVYSFKGFKKLTQLLLPSSIADRWIESYRRHTGSSDYQQLTGIKRQIFVKVVNEDLQHLMPRIKASTLLIWGDKDTATPISDAKLMNKLIPDSGLVTLEGATHYCFLEQPYKFAVTVTHFLQN